MLGFLGFFVILGFIVSAFTCKRKSETENERMNRVGNITAYIICGFFLFALIFILIYISR